MDLPAYFDSARGRGVLATADGHGRVDQAVFARPHTLEDGTLAFIMPDRRTHRNLLSNPHAAYLFMEDGPGYKGVRLFLTQVKEEEDADRIALIRRRDYAGQPGGDDPRYLVIFRVDHVLPLVGAEWDA
jgi:hypothetical protein